MPNEQEIILTDDPRAARLVTAEDLQKQPLWISRKGLITNNEERARRDGSTHYVCPIEGEIVRQGSRSEAHWKKFRKSVWENAKTMTLDEGAAMDYRVFVNEDNIAECDEDSIVEEMITWDMRSASDLWFGRPAYPRLVEESDLLELSPEGSEFSPNVRELIKKLNEAASAEVSWWEGTNIRVCCEDVDRIQAKLDEYYKESEDAP